ncbi:MAG: sigma-70 family RNA polymerase sigma factor [Clostridiales bacterium]|nr:sigma-70 family RNA polymerase sigma factor [Clostridiales bacterium]
MNDPRSDSAVVQAVLEGDINAFEVLVLRYQKKVYNTVLRISRDPSSVEDLAQEVFIKLFRGLEHFRGESSFSTYLYRVTFNTAIDALRKRNTAPGQVSLQQESEEGETFLMELPDGGPLPLEQMEQKERAEALRAAIDRLPDHHRQVILLREINELSYQEISDLLALNEGTVKSRLNRARATLRGLLEETLTRAM